MAQTGSAPQWTGSAPRVSSLPEPYRKWMLRMKRSSRMAVTDSGYPEEGREKKGTGHLSKQSLLWSVAHSEGEQADGRKRFLCQESPCTMAG